MQPIAAGFYDAYIARLRSSHDFRIEVDVLTLDEIPVGSAVMLDGQANIKSDMLVRREATMTLSDPAGALDFSDASAWHDTAVWINRLLRVTHVVTVPGHGEVRAVPFIGPAAGLSRQGAEVQVLCQDKGLLAMRGAKPLTVEKGENAVKAIRRIFATCVGEFRFRLPASTRKLSKSYSVGLSADASPFLVAAKIAEHELGQQLFYSCDGYLTLRDRITTPVADMGWVTDQASASVDFTTAINYVKVDGRTKSTTRGAVTTTTTPETVLTVKPSSTMALTRQGVDILMPLVISESAYTKTSQTAKRAKAEIDKGSGVTSDLAASVVPMFHLDWDDPVNVHSDDGAMRVMRLSESSIPFATGGEQTLGFHRWVSDRAFAKAKSRKVHTRRVHHRRHRR